MLTQIKLALRVLKRRKFFTFISLFGISFTILALVIVAAMGEGGPRGQCTLLNTRSPCSRDALPC